MPPSCCCCWSWNWQRSPGIKTPFQLWVTAGRMLLLTSQALPALPGAMFPPAGGKVVIFKAQALKCISRVRSQAMGFQAKTAVLQWSAVEQDGNRNCDSKMWRMKMKGAAFHSRKAHTVSSILYCIRFLSGGSHTYVCLFIRTVLCPEEVALICGRFHRFYTRYWLHRGVQGIVSSEQWIDVEHVAAEPLAPGMGRAMGAPGSESVLACYRQSQCSIGVTPLQRVFKRQILDAWLLTS